MQVLQAVLDLFSVLRCDKDNEVMQFQNYSN